jgi:hypothetical protein
MVGDVGSSVTETETRVLDGPLSRLTCADADRHSAQCVSTHNPWVVGSSPTRPTDDSQVNSVPLNL